MVDLVTGNSPSAIASANTARLQRLNLGISEAQAIAIMGESGGGLNHDIRNPFRVERAAAGGNEAAVLFYYTKCNPDGRTSEDELTPVVFINDKMIGYGRAALTAMAVQLQSIKK